MSKKIRAKFGKRKLRDYYSTSLYHKRPIKEGRDNKDVLVGSGGDNQNKIRYPKKCRKTAWKRFYKLFPQLKLQ